MIAKIVPTDAVLIPDDAERVFTGVIHDVYQWQQEEFDGLRRTYEMIRRLDTVRVIAVVDDQIVVIEDKQPHRGVRRSFLGGKVDRGDEPLATAKRETREEGGYEFAEWRLLTVGQPEVKAEYFIYTYLAWDASQTPGRQLQEGEDIVISKLPFDEVKQLIMESDDTFLSVVRPVFRRVDSLQELLALPEFVGKTIERES